jgi:hypothetical protein
MMRSIHCPPGESRAEGDAGLTGGGNVLGEALGRGEAVQLAKLSDRPSRRRTHETVRRRVDIAKVRKDLLRFENEVRPLACEPIECDRLSLELA